MTTPPRLPRVAALTLLLALTGCSSTNSGGNNAEGDGGLTPTVASTTAGASDGSSGSDAPEGPDLSPPGPAACYDLTFAQAGALTSGVDPVDCARRHTSATYFVGTVDPVVDGHLLAVDSDRVQAQVAQRCRDRLDGFLGGSPQALRLSMFRPVWFTPTLEEAQAGADWFRCDLVALGSEGSLLELEGRFRRILDSDRWQGRFGLCATAEPGTDGFAKVGCSRKHTWQAISTVDISAPGPKSGVADPPYPGIAHVRAAGQEECQSAGLSVAEDTLDYQWGYEWPDEAQWAAGQRWGTCWAPA